MIRFTKTKPLRLCNVRHLIEVQNVTSNEILLNQEAPRWIHLDGNISNNLLKCIREFCV